MESAPDWLLQRLAEDDKERMVQVATILWSIWTARNMKVWENKVIPPDLITENSAHQIHQWREMQPRKVVNSSINQQRQNDGDHWVAPEVGKVKINVDASVVLGSGTYSADMVLRDHHGEFCIARNYRREGDISVLEAEAGGVLEALKWVLELGVTNVTIESDSILTVRAVRNGSVNYLEVGNLFEDSRLIMRNRPDISISYVKKQANKAAHMLARVPCEVNCYNDFISPPQCWRFSCMMV